MKTLITLIASLSLLLTLAAKENRSNDKPYLGVVTEPLNKTLRAHIDIPANIGLIISRVARGTAAEKSGLKSHDIITAVNQQKVLSSVPLAQYITMHKAGEKINIAILRKNKPLTVTATLGKRHTDAVLKVFTMEDILGGKQGKDLEHLKKIQQLHKKMAGKMPEDTQKILEELTLELNLKGPGQLDIKGAVTTVLACEDDQHSITITDNKDGKILKALDSQGKVIFEGKINTAKERAAIPAGLLPKVETLEKQLKSLNIKGLK